MHTIQVYIAYILYLILSYVYTLTTAIYSYSATWFSLALAGVAMTYFKFRKSPLNALKKTRVGNAKATYDATVANRSNPAWKQWPDK